VFILFIVRKTERLIKCKTYQVRKFSKIGVTKDNVINNLNSIIFVMKLNFLSQFRCTMDKSKNKSENAWGWNYYINDLIKIKLEINLGNACNSHYFH